MAGALEPWQLRLRCRSLAAPVAQPRVPISGCPSQGTRLVSSVCLHVSCCPWCLQLAARWLPRRSVPIAGHVGRQRGSGSLQVPGAELCRYPVLSSPAAHPSTAGPRGAAGTCTHCLPQPGRFSELARALCCYGVFRAGRHWRVFAVTCSQRSREGGVFRWCWIYALKSSHLASSVSGCRKANVTVEVGRIKTRNPS